MALAVEAQDNSILERLDAQQPRSAAPSSNGAPKDKVEKAVAARVEDDEPQTQMAAAFAALKLEEKLTSETPPEETEA
jgi:hypothetical protein